MQCRGREGGEAGRGGRDVAEGERERERERVEGERAKKSAKTHCAAVRFCQSEPNLQHGRNGQKPGSKMCEQFSKNRCKNSRQRLAESRGNSQDQKTCSGQKLQKSRDRDSDKETHRETRQHQTPHRTSCCRHHSRPASKSTLPSTSMLSSISMRGGYARWRQEAKRRYVLVRTCTQSRLVDQSTAVQLY